MKLHVNECADYYNVVDKKSTELKVIKVNKKKSGAQLLTENKIVFFIEGRMKIMFRDIPGYEGLKGNFVFLLSGISYWYEAIEDSMLIVFTILNPIKLCESCSVEKLCSININNFSNFPTKSWFNELSINSRMWHFLEGLKDCLIDGINCSYFYKLKTQEMLLLLRIYYSKEDLKNFFSSILSKDIAFSEYVRLNWEKYGSIKELADSMHLTRKQFNTRFMAVFGMSPHQWIMEKKAEIIYHEIVFTKKLFKQIAMENRFSTETQFTRFCKNVMKRTPTEIREGKILD